MARRWTQWRETYGDFTLERPLSAAMKAFVAKMNADDDLDLSEAETVRDQDAGAALHPPRRVQPYFLLSPSALRREVGRSPPNQ